MSSAPNKSHQSSQSASSSEPKTDAQTDSTSQAPLPSPVENSMDQPLESTLIAAPPAPPIPSEIMSSTDSSSTDPTPLPETPVVEASATDASATDAPIASEPESLDQQATALRQQPIPPASEPMQYRAIGLVRGKYVASDEQFTRGSLFTDDGFEIGAVLLGRVMSLVKKHVNLEESHLWVVYPRTREKGDTDLHVQIVGVWEPENLNRMFESSEPESSIQEDEPELADEVSDTSDEAADDTANNVVSDTPDLHEAALSEPELVEGSVESAIEPSEDAADAQEQDETELAEDNSPSTVSIEPIASSNISAVEEDVTHEAIPPVPASELDDKYFSVRGEVIYQSAEEQQILVKIRRAPRPGTDESKAFKVVLKGSLEGKAVGYFWDLHVQREGNILVVQEGTMIGAVPPQKRSKKPPFNKRGGSSSGGRRPGGRPPHGGGPRKPWQNRDSQPRPSRGDRSASDRPVPPNRENRPPSPRPVKRRNPEKPEG